MGCRVVVAWERSLSGRSTDRGPSTGHRVIPESTRTPMATILVIDDEEPLRALLRTVLGKVGPV